MNRLWFRKVVLMFVFVAAGFAIACGGGVEGKYQDPTGTIRAQFKGGKTYLAFGATVIYFLTFLEELFSAITCSVESTCPETVHGYES